MDVESVDRAVEKLLAQGLAAVDMNGDVRRAEGSGDGRWQRGYEQQIAHRREQIDRMIAFTESITCRKIIPPPTPALIGPRPLRRRSLVSGDLTELRL